MNTINSRTPISRKPDSVKVITNILEYNDRLDIDTLEVMYMINQTTYNAEKTFLKICLKNKVSKNNYIRIWFNANDNDVLGGQGVDSSRRVVNEGINFYRNYGELKQAIEDTINQMM